MVASFRSIEAPTKGLLTRSGALETGPRDPSENSTVPDTSAGAVSVIDVSDNPIATVSQETRDYVAKSRAQALGRLCRI